MPAAVAEIAVDRDASAHLEELMVGDFPDRRITARYDFALLDRRRIVATTALSPSMVRRRSDL